LEQPLRPRRHPAGLIGAAVAALLVVALLFVVLLRPRPPSGREHAYPIPPTGERLEVEVLNGTGKAGLARVGTRQLRRQGIDVVFFGNAEGPAESTLVIVRRGARSRADRVVRALGTGRVVLEADTLRRVDASVVLGQDYRPPAEFHP
jgi:hypothetical protein